MVSFPPCKINLGLNILSRREDGYHNIETCFYPVPWTDMLEVIPSDHTAFSFSGIPILGNEEDNLCRKAYDLLNKDFELPPVQLHLHKIVPTGAGLGGGSSDAAATLKSLNDVFLLGMNRDELRSFAARLGSDCPFFIDPVPVLGTGKGDTLTPLTLNLGGNFLVLVNPGIHVSTAEAYKHVIPGKSKNPLVEILATPLVSWKGKLINDFERSVFSNHPAIARIKEKLYGMGALYAGMSGSGSSVFGLFEKEFAAADYFSEMKVWAGVLPN